MKSNETYYNAHDDDVSSCLWAMRTVLLEISEEVTETTKYGMPCFCFNGKAFCYLWTDKKTKAPYFLLVEGMQMAHPALEAGERKRMKTLPVDPKKDLPMDVILEVLNEALLMAKT
ncbi:MAG: DUF1801 domain-containing protein [Flavobacteriales bacterium]|nr:DUF1801 domain-containing protein [Flavobacteriales bacterium]MDG2245721.1 DUF1801 domain-containing protein [Flavobacteriales bacterium]